MTPYFSLKRIANFILISTCILFYGFNFHQINEEEDFLTICKNSEAYYIFSNYYVTYNKSWYKSSRDIEINSKLVVNNSSGVDNYAFLNLSELQSNNLKKIKVRTLKSDGSIVELDTSLVFKKDKENKKYGAISYPIPGVEPGDTIETSYTFSEKLEKDELMNYVNFHSEIPNIHSEYNIKTQSDLRIRYKSYNDFPEPEIISKDTILHLKFSLENINGMNINDYSCIPCELPYFYYSFDEGDSEKMRKWKDVYNEEFNIVTQPLALDFQNATYYKRWKRRIIGSAKDSSKFHQFELLHKEVQNNFTMQPIQLLEMAKPTGYFLKEEKFDYLSIKRFYRQILEDLDIPYWAVFGRSKQNGSIDPHYIRKGEYDHIFFAYENEKGSLTLLYPHDESFMYSINEIPTSLYKTDAVLVKPVNLEIDKKTSKKEKFIRNDLKLAKVDSVLATKINLPGIHVSQNYSNQFVFATVDPLSKSTSLKYRSVLSGGISTEVRSFFNMMTEDEQMNEYYNTLFDLEEDDNWLEVDSITKITLSPKKPFNFTMSGTGSLKGVVSFVNDSLVSISIDKLLSPTQIYSHFEKTELDYYIDFAYSDYFTFFLNFPTEIEVIGIGNSNKDLKNEYGEYFFEIKQSNPKQLVLKSNYKILKDFIPKEKYQELKHLNNLLDEVKNKKLIIKLKHTKKEPVSRP